MRYRLTVIAAVAGLLFFAALPGAANERVARELLAEIDDAHRSLAAEQQRVTDERSALQQRLASRQAQLHTLRAEARAMQRARDNATTSLDVLRAKLERWQDQEQYRLRLINNVLNLRGDGGIHTELTGGTQALVERIRSLAANLEPRWQPAELVDESGRMRPASQLTLGPVSWFVDESSAAAGLVATEDHPHGISLVFNERESQRLHQSAQGADVELDFDPTLGRAIRLRNQSESVFEHVMKGGIWIGPILFAALLATAIAIGKSIQLARLPTLSPALPQRVAMLANAGTVPSGTLKQLQSEVSDTESRLIDAVAGIPQSEQRNDAIWRLLAAHRAQLERFVGAIAVIASIAPLLGLLGTVSGMIKTFRLMTLFGAGDPAAVSSGISEALVTTELGLVVAIPALIVHALLTRRIKRYQSQLDDTAVALSHLKVAGRDTS